MAYVEKFYREFPPYTGGCIVFCNQNVRVKRVSSLYGRVYRGALRTFQAYAGFLPIREGVSICNNN